MKNILFFGFPAVYIVGSDSGRVTYWQNGVKTAFGNGIGIGNGIAVSGSDVYVGGTVYSLAGNGQLTGVVVGNLRAGYICTLLP